MKIKEILLVILMFFSFNFSAHAQFGFGSVIVSRYVWRGTDFGNSASVQPSLHYSVGGLEVGAWASYPISSDITSLSVNENDLFIKYSIGRLGLMITDYYFPEKKRCFQLQQR